MEKRGLSYLGTALNGENLPQGLSYAVTSRKSFAFKNKLAQENLVVGKIGLS